MDLKTIPPQNIIKISASISLILLEKYNEDEINVIKNILSSILNDISCYQTQNTIYKKSKK